MTRRHEVHVTLRMPEILRARVERYASILTAISGTPISFNAAARALISLGLDRARRK